jgi:GTPase SAR1 family protein
VLPVEIFDMPLIKIALAADISGGKTCLVLSWFRTLMDATGRGLNSHVNQMDFVPVLSAENGVDEEFREMRIEFERDNICPRGTNKQFVPPVFLKMTYRPSGNKEPHHALVGIYDAAGEVIIQSMRGDMLVYYMSFMDGIVYMIEPSKIGIQQDMVGNHLLVNDASKHFYKQAKLLSPEEQMRVQRGPFSGETLLEIMQKVGGRGNQRENRSNEVLQSLRSYVDDETLKKQYVALTISKCDELQGNPEIAPYNAGNILFLDDRRIDSGQERYRNEQILQLFKDKIFNLSVFDNVFKATSYHMIAAIGCPTEVLDKSKKHSNGSKALEKSRLLGPFAPIRAEEPMLRILSEYAEEHGWND